MSGVEFVPDTSETRKRFNDLARHQFIRKMYGEILTDMRVCELEGWNKMEFINMLWESLNHFKQTFRKERS